MSRIAGTRIEPSSEVANPVDGVLREECLSQLPKIQPSKWSVLKCAVVEIKAVYVDIGDQTLLNYRKTETATEGGLDPTVESIGVVKERYHKR